MNRTVECSEDICFCSRYHFNILRINVGKLFSRVATYYFLLSSVKYNKQQSYWNIFLVFKGKYFMLLCIPPDYLIIAHGVPLFNPLLHRHSFLRLLQQTTFENTVTKEEIAPAFKVPNLKNVYFFQQSKPRVIQDFSKCCLLQDCCMGYRVNKGANFHIFQKEY